MLHPSQKSQFFCVLYPRRCCSATARWSNAPSDSGWGGGFSRGPRRRMKRWRPNGPGPPPTWERLISKHWIGCCTERVNQSKPLKFISLTDINWLWPRLWHVFLIFWNYYGLIYFFTLFICEQLRHVFPMCHILLSISINFIVALDVIFLLHNIYTLYLLPRAIVDVNLFHFAMTLCLCTESNIQQIYFSKQLKRLKRLYINLCPCVIYQ